MYSHTDNGTLSTKQLCHLKHFKFVDNKKYAYKHINNTHTLAYNTIYNNKMTIKKIYENLLEPKICCLCAKIQKAINCIQNLMA